MKLSQLSLRDLFWLVALVAIGCGWWVDRSRLATALDEWERLALYRVDLEGFDLYMSRKSTP